MDFSGTRAALAALFFAAAPTAPIFRRRAAGKHGGGGAARAIFLLTAEASARPRPGSRWRRRRENFVGRRGGALTLARTRSLSLSFILSC